MAVRNMTAARKQRSRRPHKRGGLSLRYGQLAASLVAALGLLAVLWAGSLASAAAAERSATPAPVRYYIVPHSGHGPATLVDIARQTLGNGSRFMQIFRLNKGRLQPNGGRLESPGKIEPGWVLKLPSDARGRGVRFGPLPLPTPSASARPSVPPTSPPGAKSSASAAGLVVTTLAVGIAAALAVIGVGLFRPRRRRRRHATVVHDRGRQHARVDRPRRPERVPPAGSATDPESWSWPPSMVAPADMPADHPSRPMRAVDGQGWPADHPSRPMRAVDGQGWPADHPSRPMRAVDGQGWPADHPSRPMRAVDGQGWPADHPSRPMRAVDEQNWPDFGGREPHFAERGPGAGGWPGQPVPARPASFAGPPLTWGGPAPAPQRSPGLRPPPARVYERPAEPRAYGHRPDPRAYGRPAEPRAQEYAAGPHEQDLRPSDALRLAGMLLSEAEAEAYKIRAEADAVRAEASAQAATLREAAERDAAKVRASLDAMSAELNQVAAFVTRRLMMPDEAQTGTEADVARPESAARAIPAAPAQTAPQSRPRATRQASASAARATAKTDTAPRISPVKRPGERPRQLRAARAVVVAIAGLLLLGVASGTAEVLLHGMPFFVFRSAGTGGTHDGPEEDQGPGQPDAPGAHHHSAPSHHLKDHHVRPARHHAGGSTH